MAHIDRPVKTGSTRRYTNEVASGFDLIRETEVDGDFDIVYGEINGGLDDSNIRPGASIDYSKLDLTGRLQGSDFDPTPTTPLPPGAYGPGGIPIGALPPNAIGPDQIAFGATLFDYGQQQKSVDEAQNGNVPVIGYLSALITPRAADKPVRVSVSVMGTVATSALVDINVTVRIKRDAATLVEIRRFMKGGDQQSWTITWESYQLMSLVEHTISVDVYQPGPNFTLNMLQAGTLVCETPT